MRSISTRSFWNGMLRAYAVAPTTTSHMVSIGRPSSARCAASIAFAWDLVQRFARKSETTSSFASPPVSRLALAASIASTTLLVSESLEPAGEEENDAERAAREAAVVASLVRTFDLLLESRRQEGRRLEAVIDEH